MDQRFKKPMLAASVCAGLAALANPAAAFQVIWNDATNRSNAQVEIWHAGSSAALEELTLTPEETVIAAFCDPAQDIDLYFAGWFWAVACVGQAGLPASLAGKTLLWNRRYFFEDDPAGSVMGIGPVALGSPVGFMKPSTNNPGSGINCTDPDGDRIWQCNTPKKQDPKTITSQVPNIGTSDIEPDKFASHFRENVPDSDPDYDLDGTPGPALPDYTAQLKTLRDRAVAHLVFGVAANLLMYRDLQRAQFPSGHPLYDDCNPAGANYGSIWNKAANANLEKCMPSLTGQEIRSIFAQGGAIRTAADFQMESPPGSGTYVRMTATGTTDNTIQIVRRVKGSGTQAQFNAIMLGYPCDATYAVLDGGAIDTLVPEGEDGGFNDFVSENETALGVGGALHDYNNGTNHSGKNPSRLWRWAIGLQSLDNNPGDAFGIGRDYRFLKIDGFAPTLVNVHAGDYHAFAAQTLQYKTGAPTYVVDAHARFALADPTKLAALNKDYADHPFGESGWLGVPSSTFFNRPSAELDFNRPVNWFQRVSSSGKNNTCALPSAFPKSGGVDITVAPQNCSANGNADGKQNCYTAP